MFLGRFLDSDAVYFPPGGGFKLVELAPNVQHVVGGTANNLIVAMKDCIVVFDAPLTRANRAGSSTRRRRNIQASRSPISC